jgi:hypothetical protein
MPDEDSLSTKARRTPWNKGKLIGAKPPLRPNQVWSIRTRLLIESARCRAGAQLPATSCLGAFWTPVT